MNGTDAADESSFYLDYETQLDATRDAVSKLAREVLQYEWADYLRRYPPTATHEWEFTDTGKPWGRITPHAWRLGREAGFDVHFEHYPTPRALERGQLRVELHLEDGIHGDADFEDGSRYSRLRERIYSELDAVGHDAHEQISGGRGTGRVIWQSDARFIAGDPVAYYEALRRTLEAHAVFVDVVTSALHHELQSE
ncbi:acetyltransferase [Haloferax namakaokahaiae]|uniref:Acetyltransferase n=1 Tax=Haloferax namakaokahaiae TaxID=1748331 RepID=A0ABD5ZBL3_9EURY